MTKLYPIEVEMKLKLTDGNRVAEATVGLGLFKAPTEERVDSAVRSALEMVSERMPGFRPMTYDEIWDERFSERTGSDMLFAAPSMKEGEEWWREESREVLEEVWRARSSRSSMDDEEDER